MTDADYTMAELMVAAAAREIRDGEVVFVGMRLPLLAFLLAKSTHAPRALSIYENGIIRATPSRDPVFTVSDPTNNLGAIQTGSALDALGILQRGRVDLGFIGGAEVDRYGNLNTSYIGGWKRPAVRLPGSGGGCDIASLAGRLLIIMAHERRRFKARVDYVTSPGYGDGGDWRRRMGLPRGGPAAVITTLGVLRFDPEGGEMYLDACHPGVTPEQVQAATAWPLRVSPQVGVTLPPTEPELRIIRQYDPQGFWTR
ncbi:MAG: CoA-transferase [Deltaproteobacteria bacterium]|nr:CoA-transferase [Deltaproteobacteria bacterium]